MDLLWLILGDEGGPIGYNPCIWVYIILCTTLYGMYTSLKWALLHTNTTVDPPKMDLKFWHGDPLYL